MHYCSGVDTDRCLCGPMSGEVRVEAAVNYDAEANALYILFQGGPWSIRTFEGTCLVDVNESGDVVGLELIDVGPAFKWLSAKPQRR